ncbi:hypothetical protein KEM55_006585 [Ascosphaera atra]|nr:hypothetical protein KEM55_006585 [Ascosphaera atra]
MAGATAENSTSPSHNPNHNHHPLRPFLSTTEDGHSYAGSESSPPSLEEDREVPSSLAGATYPFLVDFQPFPQPNAAEIKEIRVSPRKHRTFEECRGEHARRDLHDSVRASRNTPSPQPPTVTGAPTAPSISRPSSPRQPSDFDQRFLYPNLSEDAGSYRPTSKPARAYRPPSSHARAYSSPRASQHSALETATDSGLKTAPESLLRSPRSSTSSTAGAKAHTSRPGEAFELGSIKDGLPLSPTTTSARSAPVSVSGDNQQTQRQHRPSRHRHHHHHQHSSSSSRPLTPGKPHKASSARRTAVGGGDAGNRGSRSRSDTIAAADDDDDDDEYQILGAARQPQPQPQPQPHSPASYYDDDDEDSENGLSVLVRLYFLLPIACFLCLYALATLTFLLLVLPLRLCPPSEFFSSRTGFRGQVSRALGPLFIYSIRVLFPNKRSARLHALIGESGAGAGVKAGSGSGAVGDDLEANRRRSSHASRPRADASSPSKPAPTTSAAPARSSFAATTTATVVAEKRASSASSSAAKQQSDPSSSSQSEPRIFGHPMALPFLALASPFAAFPLVNLAGIAACFWVFSIILSDSDDGRAFVLALRNWWVRGVVRALAIRRR